MTAAEGRQRLAVVLASRRIPPPLIPDRPWTGVTAEARYACVEISLEQAELRIAAAVIGDRLDDALGEPACGTDARAWQAVALRRSGRFPEARRAFRELGAGPAGARLFECALVVLQSGGGGFRWAAESAAHLRARGGWDPLWFVDSCAAVDSGLLSRESAALLEQIQYVELQLLLDAGAVG